MSSTEWETPQDIFNTLNDEFGFTVDVCATPKNAKCDRYYTLQHGSLDRDWSNEVVWMNPPYSDRSDQSRTFKWVRKAYRTSQKGGTVVALIPSRSTDVDWWHEYVIKASELRFVRDRLHFKQYGIPRRANHSSVVVVFRPYCQGPPVVSGIDTKGHPVDEPVLVGAT